MIIKMLGQKRIRYHDASLELWLDFHKRRYRKAKEIVQGYNVDIVALLRKKRLSYAKHLARMGMDMNETHLIKLLVLWRNLEWWRKQQHQLMIGGSDFRHPGRFKPRRWEEQFCKDWINHES